MPEQSTPAAEAPGAPEAGRPDQGEQSGGDPDSPGSSAEEQSCLPERQHGGGGDACIAQAAAVAGERPAAGSSDLEAALSLLLPGLAIAGGPKGTVNTGAPPQVELAEPPAKAEHGPACTAAPSWLEGSPAAEAPQALRQGSHAAAAPEGQAERLRAFVCKQICSADMDSAIPAYWPASLDLRAADSGLYEGGRAECLFRRMGSTPAAAALLRSLVCPITKVRITSQGALA